MKNKIDILGNHLIPIGVFAVMSLIASVSNGWVVSQGPGITVPEPPIQEIIKNGERFRHEGYAIKPMAEFELKAKVISKQKYKDEWSDICPFDFTLGWGKLSDESIIRQLWFLQKKRRTYFQVDNLPDGVKPKDLILLQSNMHLCPSNEVIAKRLRQVPLGALIHLKGKLIGLNKENTPWFNESSLSRDDTGDGACEIIWVEEFEIKTEGHVQD